MDRIEAISELEVAAGWVFGHVPDSVVPEPGVTADQAISRIEEAIADVRGDQPCFVAFSGGRDSSVVLALAARAARDRGLPDPVPVTAVYEYAPETEETEWQEQVIRHLGLTEWVRRRVEPDEADLLGPTAQRLLTQHGSIWPAATPSNYPIYSAAAGGVLLTGEGGDNVFGQQRITVLRAIAARKRLSRRALVVAAQSLSPAVVRAARARRSADDTFTWLRPGPRREVGNILARSYRPEPLHWYRAMLRTMRTRSADIGLHNMGVVCADAGATLSHPLRHPRFVGSLASITGRWGFPDRNSLMAHLFGDLLPRELFTRRSKAQFNTAFFGRHSRRFVEQWDGSGVPTDLIDPVALRKEWSEECVSGLTFMILQRAWLASTDVAIPGVNGSRG